MASVDDQLVGKKRKFGEEDNGDLNCVKRPSLDPQPEPENPVASDNGKGKPKGLEHFGFVKLGKATTSVAKGSLMEKPHFVGKFQEIIPKYYKYKGHKMEDLDRKQFLAVCVECEKTNAVTVSNFDEHNFKSNARRHYQRMHKAVEWELITENHKMDAFAQVVYTKKYSGKDPYQNTIDTCYMDLVAIDGLPLNFTAGLGFAHFMFKLNSRVRLTSRFTLSRYFNARKTSVIRKDIREELSLVEHHKLHLSTDIWSSRRGDGVIALRCHFISEDKDCWKLNHRTIGLTAFNDYHTAKNIEQKIMEILEVNNVPRDKVGYVATDGAANVGAAVRMFDSQRKVESISMQAAIPQDDDDSEDDAFSDDASDNDDEMSDSDLDNDEVPINMIEDDDDDDDDDDSDDELHEDDRFVSPDLFPNTSFQVICYAHSLQLIINAGVKTDEAAKAVIKSTKKIVRFLNKSTHWKAELRKKCGRAVVQTVTTRWNSHYDCLKCLTQENVYAAVVEIIHQAKTAKKASKAVKRLPNLDARATLIDLQKLLCPVAVAIDALQSDSVTSSIVLYQLIKCFGGIADCNTSFSVLKNAMIVDMKERFEKRLKETFVVISTLLDPYQKQWTFKWPWPKFGTVEFTFPTVECAISILRREYSKHYRAKPLANAIVMPDDAFPELRRYEDAPAVEIPEIDKYLAAARELGPRDILGFWKNNMAIYPTLAQMAKQYLAIPASTGGVERIFSVAGSFARSKRANLTPSTLENLILYREHRLPKLKEWLKQKTKAEADAKKAKNQSRSK